jgi:hypothetical protein
MRPLDGQLLTSLCLEILLLNYVNVAESVESVNRTMCDGLVIGWLSQLQPRVNGENSTLSVDWSRLGRDLKEQECELDHLYLELWRVVSAQVQKRPSNFGSYAYFAAYERCNKLEPEHFIIHSTQAYRPNQTVATFTHVVEDEYMLRLCPCGRRRHQRVCDCQYESIYGKAQCSRILQVATHQPTLWRQDPSVMPWCLPSIEGAKSSVKEVNLKSLLMNCTHVLVAGTMASCTPIQPYDRVMLTFHRLENASSETCWQDKDFGTHNPIRIVSRLFSQNPIINSNNSNGVGDFTAIVGLVQDSSYCVQIEHVDHPYCVREITIGQLQKMPEVCSAHMAKPISTAKCSFLPPNIITNFPVIHDPLFVGGIALVFAIVFVLVLGWTVCRCVGGKHTSKRTKTDLHGGNFEIERVPILFKPPTPYCDQQPKGRVFLLHFLLEDEEDVRCQLLREWIQSFSDQVDDLENSDEDESINQDPHGWVTSRLTSQDVRVIVVASKSVIGLLQPQSEGSRASCTTSSTGVSSCTPTSSLCSSRQSISDTNSDEASLIDDVGICSSGDPRKELRVFALKCIRAHYAGNYRQLAVVSLDRASLSGETVAGILTPNKGPLVLPHHLSHLQEWVASGKQLHTSKACCISRGRPSQHQLEDELPLSEIVESSQTLNLGNLKDGGESLLAERRLREALEVPCV